MRHLRLVHSTEGYRMSVKIAFASSDRKQVDQHFGAAEAFTIYELTKDEFRVVEVVEFSENDTSMDGNESKLVGKIALLGGCAAVYCNAVGASAIRQLLAAGIQPMKVSEGTPIDAVLCGLNSSLKSEAPAWLAKHLNRMTTERDRFAFMDEEGWSE